MNKMDWNRKPHPVLDYLLETYKIRSDNQLCMLLDYNQPEMSKIRNGHIKGRPELCIAINEVFDMPIKQMREMAGDEFIGIHNWKKGTT